MGNPIIIGREGKGSATEARDGLLNSSSPLGPGGISRRPTIQLGSIRCPRRSSLHPELYWTLFHARGPSWEKTLPFKPDPTPSFLY